MTRALPLGVALVWLAGAAAALDHAALAARVVRDHVLPGQERFAAEAAALAAAAEAGCASAGPVDLAAPYHVAFDAWMGVSHLRFGPAEEGDAVFAVAFWPDPRGATPKTLATLIAAEDPVVDDPKAFAGSSVAGRGLFALDALLFDPEAPKLEAGTYRCRLAVAVTRDLAATAARLRDRWRDPWAGLLETAGAEGHPLWFTPVEGTRAIYGALVEGLQATIDLRLGRPLGTFDAPQPRRAEAWRSGRSLRNVTSSLEALRALARVGFEPELAAEDVDLVESAFASALAATHRIDAPLPEAVAAPEARIRVEALRTEVVNVREVLATRVGGDLGLAAGFNAMDGD